MYNLLPTPALMDLFGRCLGGYLLGLQRVALFSLPQENLRCFLPWKKSKKRTLSWDIPALIWDVYLANDLFTHPHAVFCVVVWWINRAFVVVYFTPSKTNMAPKKNIHSKRKQSSSNRRTSWRFSMFGARTAAIPGGGCLGRSKPTKLETTKLWKEEA